MIHYSPNTTGECTKCGQTRRVAVFYDQWSDNGNRVALCLACLELAALDIEQNEAADARRRNEKTYV